MIDEAWRYKQMLGGAMRQAGIVAAAGLYALDHHVERLAEDHARAQAAGRGARGRCPASSSTRRRSRRTSSSSRCPTRAAFTAALAAEDVEMSHFGPTRVRAVTHLDVDADGIERALAVAAQALQ